MEINATNLTKQQLPTDISTTFKYNTNKTTKTKLTKETKTPTFTYYSPKLRNSLTYSNTQMMEYPLRAPTLYNSSQNQKLPTTHKNRTKVESINLHVTHAKCHTSGRLV